MLIQEYTNVSDWILQDDNVTELMQLIGISEEGFHFGHVLGWPTSEPHWDQTPYESEQLAKEAMIDNYLRSLDFEVDDVYVGEFCFVNNSPNIENYSNDYIDFLDFPF